MLFGWFSSKKPSHTPIGEKGTTKDGSFDALIETFLAVPEDKQFISRICYSMMNQDLGEQKEKTSRYFTAQTMMTEDKRYFLELRYVASEGECVAYVKLDRQEVDPFFVFNKQSGATKIYVKSQASKDSLLYGVM